MAKANKNSVAFKGEVTKVVMKKGDVAVVTMEIPARSAHQVPIEKVEVYIERIQPPMKFGEIAKDEEVE